MKKWNQRYHDKFKKHSLINQVWDEKNLEIAWKRVKANKGSAGIDQVTIPEFQQNLPQNLVSRQSYNVTRYVNPGPS